MPCALQFRRKCVSREEDLTVGHAVGITKRKFGWRNLPALRTLESCKLVERAKGTLQHEIGLHEEEAYFTLQKQGY